MQAQCPRPAPPRRYVAIDGLRFIAALAVVAHHYSGFVETSLFQTSMAKNYLFVDFFFAISGFVIFHNYGARIGGWPGYLDFLRNRLARVYPLHLATFLAFAALAYTLWRDKTDRSFVDPDAILPNLLLMHAWGLTKATSFNYPSWSISAEWFAYLSFPAVVWLIRRGGACAAFAMAALIVVGLEVAHRVGLIEGWTTLSWHFGALRGLPTFLFGAGVAKSIDRLPARIDTFLPGMALFAAAAIGMIADVDDRLILVLLMGAFVATTLAERNGAQGWLTRPAMARLGDLSYAIYMIHPIVAVVFINFLGLKTAHLSGEALLWWCVFCAIAPNTILAAGVYAWLERPARGWVRRLGVPTLSAFRFRVAQPPGVR